MKSLWPTKSQWRGWTLPSKLTAIGTMLGLASLASALTFHFMPLRTASDQLIEESAGRGERLEKIVTELRETQIHTPKLYINYTGESQELWDTIRLIEEVGIKVQATRKPPEEAAMFAEINGRLTYPRELKNEAEKVRAIVQRHIPVPVWFYEAKIDKTGRAMTLVWYYNKFGLILVANKQSVRTERLVNRLKECGWVVSVSYDQELSSWVDRPFVVSRQEDISAKLIRDLRPLGRVETRGQAEHIVEVGSAPVLFWVD